MSALSANTYLASLINSLTHNLLLLAAMQKSKVMPSEQVVVKYSSPPTYAIIVSSKNIVLVEIAQLGGCFM